MGWREPHAGSRLSQRREKAYWAIPDRSSSVEETLTEAGLAEGLGASRTP